MTRRADPTARKLPLCIRTCPTLKARLEGAARVNGWSLTREIETRLLRSFDLEAINPLEDMRRVIREELAELGVGA